MIYKEFYVTYFELLWITDNFWIAIKSFCNPANIYLLKVNNRNWRRSGVLMFNFEHILQLFLVFLVLTLNK